MLLYVRWNTIPTIDIPYDWMGIIEMTVLYYCTPK